MAYQMSNHTNQKTREITDLKLENSEPYLRIYFYPLKPKQSPHSIQIRCNCHMPNMLSPIFL